MSAKIKVAVIGGAGFTGGEMIRLLLGHPAAELAFVHSRSHAGQPVHQVHGDLFGDTDLQFTGDQGLDADLWMLCLGHGESRQLLDHTNIPDQVKIIDLSQDFRTEGAPGKRHFIYGLPEWQRDRIRDTGHVANPGCFATAILLGLLPLAFRGLLKEVHTTGITGSTGAGSRMLDSTQFHWRSGNVNAYKTLSHQHLGEIRMVLESLQPGFREPLNFIPWRGGFTRGIFVSSYLQADLTLEQARDLYREYYAGHPFTHVSDRMVDIKQVVNTNKVLIFLEKAEGKIVIHSVLDNLLKGASGQAVQNMNLMCGLPEETGLRLKSTAF